MITMESMVMMDVRREVGGSAQRDHDQRKPAGPHGMWRELGLGQSHSMSSAKRPGQCRWYRHDVLVPDVADNAA